uniref:Uncharacterized protein n=1 Tax=Solanum lycopersicum TaxID=4081 RepID=A0A3Q7FZL5_SOLLC
MPLKYVQYLQPEPPATSAQLSAENQPAAASSANVLSNLCIKGKKIANFTSRVEIQKSIESKRHDWIEESTKQIIQSIIGKVVARNCTEKGQVCKSGCPNCLRKDGFRSKSPSSPQESEAKVGGEFMTCSVRGSDAPLETVVARAREHEVSGVGEAN